MASKIWKPPVKPSIYERIASWQVFSKDLSHLSEIIGMLQQLDNAGGRLLDITHYRDSVQYRYVVVYQAQQRLDVEELT